MNKTIASIATAAGQAGIAIVRVSGPDARRILQAVFKKKKAGGFESHRLYYGRIQNQNHDIDEGMAVLMAAPASYTREDVAEIHCHGGDVPARLTLQAVLDAGAALAQPGEFTKRAFLNGRISLNQAEAVMDLIGASTQRAARQALNAMGTGLYKQIAAMQERLLDVVAALEAFIDYPGEDVAIEQAAQEGAAQEILPIAQALQKAVAAAGAAQVLKSGVRVVLFGRPNAGKSSLLNRLLDEERAIVTDIPGTTRDILRERGSVNGLPVTFSDTAGLHEASDQVERIGVERARQEIAGADIGLLVLDLSAPLAQQLQQIDPKRVQIVAANKTDLNEAFLPEELQQHFPTAKLIKTSALEGEGIDQLRAALYELAVQGQSPEDSFLQNKRQEIAALDAATALESAQTALEQGLMDCAALDIRQAYFHLGLITGQTADENIIDRIFERFCLGK